MPPSLVVTLFVGINVLEEAPLGAPRGRGASARPFESEDMSQKQAVNFTPARVNNTFHSGPARLSALTASSPFRRSAAFHNGDPVCLTADRHTQLYFSRS